MSFDLPSRIPPEQERLFDIALRLDPRLKPVLYMIITQTTYIRPYDEFGMSRYHDRILSPMLQYLEEFWIERKLPRTVWNAVVTTLSWLVNEADPGNGPGFVCDPGGLAVSCETYNGRTLENVYSALKRSGLTLSQATDAVTEMQNGGILFRERGAES